MGPHANPPTGRIIVASFLMLQAVIAPGLPIVGQIWSLSAEWWHYVVAPWLTKLRAWWLLLFIAASFVCFMKISPPPGGGAEGFLYGLSFVTLSWLWVSGFLYQRWKRAPIGWLLLAVPSIYAWHRGQFTGVPLFVTIGVMILCSEIRLPARAREICNFLGEVSFPLYLFHTIVLILFASYGVSNTVVMVLSALAASVAMLYLVDYPCQKYGRRHLAASRSAAILHDNPA